MQKKQHKPYGPYKMSQISVAYLTRHPLTACRLKEFPRD